MTHVDRADLIDLLASVIGDEAARRALDEAAPGCAPPDQLDPADALALLARCAARPDAVGAAAGLAHQRLALRVARQRGCAARAASPRGAFSDRRESGA